MEDREILQANHCFMDFIRLPRAFQALLLQKQSLTLISHMKKKNHPSRNLSQDGGMRSRLETGRQPIHGTNGLKRNNPTRKEKNWEGPSKLQIMCKSIPAVGIIMSSGGSRVPILRLTVTLIVLGASIVIFVIPLPLGAAGNPLPDLLPLLLLLDL